MTRKVNALLVGGCTGLLVLAAVIGKYTLDGQAQEPITSSQQVRGADVMPPSSTSKPRGNSPTQSELVDTASLPDPELVDDLDMLMDSLYTFCTERNDDFARLTALDIRRRYSDRADRLVARFRFLVDERQPEVDERARISCVAYLVLAMPPEAIEQVIAILCKRWDAKALSDHRKEAKATVNGRPIYFEYRQALIADDLPIAGALGFALADAIGDQRFDKIVQVMMTKFEADPAQHLVTLPDPWLSEVLFRLAVRKWNLSGDGLAAVRAFCARVAGNEGFSERLRYQARMMFQETPPDFAALLRALQAAQSEFEAGSALAKYWNEQPISPEELLLILTALRGTDYAGLASVVIQLGLKDSQRMQSVPALQKFALDVLQLTNHPSLSDRELAQLAACVHVASVQALHVSLDASRSRDARRELFFQHIGRDARVEVERLIEKLRSELDLKKAEKKVLAWNVAHMIIELDEPQEVRLALMERLLDTLGGSRDGISGTILQVMLLAHQRYERDFTEYVGKMITLFLMRRGSQPHLVPASPNSEQTATLDFVCHIALYHREYPDVPFSPASITALRVLIADARMLVRRDSERASATPCLKAIEELERSWLLR